MQHLDEGTIHAWLDGELPPAEQQDAEAHVAACDECKAAVAEARGFIAASARILTALDAVPGGVLPASSSSVPKARAPARFGISRAWMAAAAVLVLSTATVIAVRPRRERAALSVAEVSRRDAPAIGVTSAAPAMVDSVAGGANGGTPPKAPAEKMQAKVPASPRASEPSRQLMDKTSDKSSDLAAARVKDSPNAVRAAPEAPTMVAHAAAAPQQSNLEAAPDSAIVLSRHTTINDADTIVTTIYRVRGAPVTLVDRSAGSAELRIQSRIAPSARPTPKLRDTSIVFNSLTWSDSTGRTHTLRGELSQDELERIKAELFGATR